MRSRRRRTMARAGMRARAHVCAIAKTYLDSWPSSKVRTEYASNIRAESAKLSMLTAQGKTPSRTLSCTRAVGKIMGSRRVQADYTRVILSSSLMLTPSTMWKIASPTCHRSMECALKGIPHSRQPSSRKLVAGSPPILSTAARDPFSSLTRGGHSYERQEALNLPWATRAVFV